MSIIIFVNDHLLCQISSKFKHFSNVFILFLPFANWIIKQLKSQVINLKNLSLALIELFLSVFFRSDPPVPKPHWLVITKALTPKLQLLHYFKEESNREEHGEGERQRENLIYEG